MSANYHNSSRDVLNLDDELNQSFYEAGTEDQSEQNTEFYFKSKESTNLESEFSKQTHNGILDEETIVKNLSNLGRDAEGNKYVYLTLTLPGHKLNDITELNKYKFVQNLDLSYNQLKDLSILSELRHLLSLNVSNNKIEKLFDFYPPYFLKEANFSFNEITDIGNLATFDYLQTLILDHNKIGKIEGLQHCHRLKHLNLGHNNIKKIEGLENLPIVTLDLRSNQIKKIEGLQTLKFLRFLNLSGNMIRSINGIPERHEFLESIDLEDNKIAELVEIDKLIELDLLRDLNLHQNPIREVSDYRLSIVYRLPKLTTLDRRKIDPSEKVTGNSLFNPTVEYIASRDHMTNLVFSFIQDHRVKESTLPSIDSPYPILILCGPEGCGRIDISKKLVEEYPDYFDFVVSHTTREPKGNERNKIDYFFTKIDQFEQDVTHGRFICCNEYFGNWYGIQSDVIESIAKQGLACVIQSELEGLLSFKQTYFEPRCVLLITLNKKTQIQRLINEECTDEECEVAVNRTEWYAEYNRNNPGFFDAVIVTDDLNEGYENLRNLVLTYLGLNQEQIKESVRPKTSDEIRRLEETFSKDLELPRSGTGKSSFWLDSFLPSNTVTANRSRQSSHQSMESLSQFYNQSLRMKFGSAPAQLITKGLVAEKSFEKRSENLRKEIIDGNNVSVKNKMSQQTSKSSERDSAIGSFEHTKRDIKSKSADYNNPNHNESTTDVTMKTFKTTNTINTKTTTKANKINYDSPDSSDNEENNEKRHSSITPHSRQDSRQSTPNSATKAGTRVKLPLLDIRSPPTIKSSNNEESLLTYKRKADLVLPTIS